MRFNSSVRRAIALSAVVLFGIAGAAAAQEACTTYTVKDGDTLGSISNTAYGSYDYQRIFNANRDLIAASPNQLAPGTELVLPCLDGRLRPDLELSSITEQETERFEESREKSTAYSPPIKLVAGDDWLPFTDTRLEGGGILTKLTVTAFSRGGNDKKTTLAWVDHWSSHLDVLLPQRAYDLSIGWDGIDCTKMDLLSPDMVRRCTDLVLSDPVYEIVYGFYSLPDNPFAGARSFGELLGARICRPDGWATADLEVEGLGEPAVTFVQPAAAADCVKALLAGEADVYSIELETAVSTIEGAQATDQILQNTYLIKIVSLHVATHISNERGKKYIELLNAGLAEMRETGEWYDIVATGLAEASKITN